jgi:hypothetical protein
MSLRFAKTRETGLEILKKAFNKFIFAYFVSYCIYKIYFLNALYSANLNSRYMNILNRKAYTPFGKRLPLAEVLYPLSSLSSLPKLNKNNLKLNH